jgi:GR25 family glycosyltransferase involved in LPS biosynthesis
MKLAYTIFEVERHENSKILRNNLSFIDELKTKVCNGNIDYLKYVNSYNEYKHIFDSLTNLGFIGLWISTLNAFHTLLQSNYDSLLILEDDVILVDGFEKKFQLCLNELPNNFGLLSIGYRDMYLRDYNTTDSIDDKKYISRLFQSGDSWGILYNRLFVEELLFSIKKYKILFGLSDTAILSYALENVSPNTKYNSYSVNPNVGSLLKHDNDINKSTIQNSYYK